MLNLLPREDKFYKMLDDLGVQAKESAYALKIFVESGDNDEVKKAGEAISHSKVSAKKINQALTEEICRTLITPFDREDIQEIAHSLYDVPKLIEKIKDRMETHGLQDREGDFKRFVTIICREADALEAVLDELSGRLTTKTIHAKAAVLNELEDQGDHVLGDATAQLFKDVDDFKELILRKDLYEMLEDVTDFYRDAANVALRIVLKHS